MTKAQIIAAHYRKLGKARARKLTPERRQEIGRMGGLARAKKLLDASKKTA